MGGACSIASEMASYGKQCINEYEGDGLVKKINIIRSNHPAFNSYHKPLFTQSLNLRGSIVDSVINSSLSHLKFSTEDNIKKNDESSGWVMPFKHNIITSIKIQDHWDAMAYESSFARTNKSVSIY